jgi:hypothetical protein
VELIGYAAGSRVPWEAAAALTWRGLLDLWPYGEKLNRLAAGMTDVVIVPFCTIYNGILAKKCETV